MRTIAILLFTCVFCAMTEPVYTQNTKVTIEINNVSIKKVLNEIENQTDYLFIYNDEVNINEKVSVVAKKESVSKVLNKILKEKGINYVVEGNHIILSSTNSSSSLKSSSVQQQKKQVAGTVVDFKGEAIVGANVVELGDTFNGAITNIDGNFTINVDNNAILRISYIGYIDQEINTAGKNSFRIVLEEDAKALDEVVVVGYGTQKKSDLTGAVSNISTDKLNVQSNSTIGQALQGKIAGVDIVSQGGRPGTGTRVMIRGIGTLNNATPLYIVDGMYLGSIDDINPNDIKSIDVLKDASAAAIYGSRAANGVVIITTKSGFDTDGKPLFEFSLNAGIQTPEKYLDMLNASEWADITTKARATINKPAPELATNLGSRPDNDWQRLLMGPSTMQNYNMSVRGGSKYFTYSTGLGYLRQEGLVDNTNFDRYNAQMKAEYKRGVFTFGSNLILSSQKRKPLNDWGRTNMIGVILQTVPTLPIRNENAVGGYGKVIGDLVDIPNPMGLLDNELFDYTNRSYDLFMNIYGEVALPYGFKYRLNYSPDFSWTRRFTYQNVYDFGLTKNTSPWAADNQYFSNNSLVENLLNYENTFGKHKITALLGYSFHKFNYRYIMGSGKGLPLGVKEVTAATEYRATNTDLQESALTSIISRIFYSYDNKYMITATLRRDGSSKFAKDNRYGNFPSISFGWNVGQEEFMSDVEWLDQFKIRGGYGVLGNQEIANYQYESLITTNINYVDGNGGVRLGAFPKMFSSPSIKWEETAMTNIGVDIMALNQRLSVVFDLFSKDTKDILLRVPIPYSTGASNDPIGNAGKVNNKGLEFTLSWRDAPSSDFKYGITFTGTAVKNEVVKMGTENGVLNGGTFRTGASTTRTLAGSPIGGFWLIKTNGIFQSDEEAQNYKDSNGNVIQPAAKGGDIRFIDFNNDGKITGDDRQYIGSPFPTFTSGLNFNAQYRNFDALVAIQGVFGNKIYNGTRLELEGVDKGSNYLATVLDHWTPENKDAEFPRLVYDDPNLNNRPESDRFLEDGSFVRLKSIQLGYTFDNSLFSNKLSKARVSLSMENLLTFTKYTGYTPDINSGDATSRGFDFFNYPSARTFVLGLQINF